ncbi:MAG: PD40 domain-containing protein, partial [Thermomicrobiales bacterium]|nr:PD40 domain-containing protein [Thermomicrobiales bacterium]
LQPWGPDGLFDFWVTNLETGESTQVATGLQSATPVDHWLSPVWGSNGLAGVAHDVTGFYSFPIEGLGLDLVPPTSEVVATETPAIPSPVPDSSTGTPAGGPVRSVETPDGRAVAMSPDGTYLAVVVPPQGSLCIYAVETMAEVSCADLSVLNTMLRIEDVVWSPDSTMIAFSEQAFITFEDGDLWVMDATTGTLTNLTDDGFDGNLLSQDDEDITFWIDVAPAWTPDSQFITFSRSEFENSQHVGNVVAQVPAAGGAIETLAEITDEAPGVWYYRGEWSPDGARLYYSVTYQDPENPDNGIWVYDAGTGTTALLAVSADPEELGPLVLSQVSSDGTRLLAWYPVAVQAYPYLGRSPLTFVDAATGELSAVPDPAPESELFEGTWIATLSPDGQYLLQAVGLDAGATDFWVTNLATGESTQVASDLEDAVPVYYGLTPVWGTNGTVFVSWNVIGAHFFPIEGAGLSGGATPAESTPETSSASGLTGLSTESEMVTNGITPVFAMPDPEATVVTFLPPGHTVHLLAGPVTNAAGMWYPMYDPDSQVIGYIQASRLEPTE